MPLPDSAKPWIDLLVLVIPIVGGMIAIFTQITDILIKGKSHPKEVKGFFSAAFAVIVLGVGSYLAYDFSQRIVIRWWLASENVLFNIPRVALVSTLLGIAWGMVWLLVIYPRFYKSESKRDEE